MPASEKVMWDNGGKSEESGKKRIDSKTGELGGNINWLLLGEGRHREEDGWI